MLGFRSVNVRRFVTRRFSTKANFVDLKIDQDGIGLLSMKRLPVNSLNLDMLQEISTSIDVVQKNQCKGLILTSAAKIFSAGIDLTELNKPDLQRLRTFWSTLQDIVLKLYGSGETTSAAAINGYTAAGGCVLSLLCDYRVMVNDPKAKIGLNDTLVGIVPGPWLCGVMNRVMGHRDAERALVSSTMYSAEQALKVNMIDELATDKEDAIEKCKQFIKQYDNIPVHIKAKTNINLRADITKQVTENREEDLKLFIGSITDVYAQKQIEFFTQQLKSKGK